MPVKFVGCLFRKVFGTMAYPAYGSFAEYARARTDSISLKPRNLSHAQASALPLAGG